MKFFRRHWYNVGLVVGAIALGWTFLGHLTTIQFILLLNFVVLTVHQFEEYGWPGGFPWIMNEVIQPKGGPADRYLLNQSNACFVNVLLAYPFYLMGVFFPNVIWMGLAGVVFGFGQFGFHGIFANVKLKGFYNPGMVAVIFGHIPVGIWYIVEVYSKGTIPPLDWILAVLCCVALGSGGIAFVSFRILADRNSPYPFAPEEMQRFDRDRRLARIRNAGTISSVAK